MNVDSLATALVTGATDGIGFAVAKGLLKRGFNVVVTARNKPDFLLPEGMHFIEADHLNPDTPKAVAEEVKARFGSLTALVNNVGRRHGAKISELEWASLVETLTLNVVSHIMLTKELVPLFNEEGGAIVNLSSRLAKVGMEGVAGYSASKGGINGFTIAAAVELAPKKIRVNAVAPGMTKTALIDEWLREQGDPLLAEKNVAARVPLGRLAEADDIAEPVVFLASPESRYITGMILTADGGYSVG